MKYCLIIDDGELFACCHSEPVPVAMVNQCLLMLYIGHSEVLPYC